MWASRLQSGRPQVQQHLCWSQLPVQCGTHNVTVRQQGCWQAHLDHNGVPAGHRRGHLHDPHEQWPIPGDDGPTDTLEGDSCRERTALWQQERDGDAGVQEEIAVQVSKCSMTAPPPDCEVGMPGIVSRLQLDCTSLLVACAGSVWQQHAGMF